MGKASLTIAIGGSYDGKALKKAEQDLQKMGIAAAREMGGVTGSLASFGDSLTGIGKDVTDFGKGVEDMGVRISKLTAPLAVAGAAALKLASDYEDSVAKVYTIMDKSMVSTGEMSDTLLDLSDATGRSATELADATYQALSASVSTDKVAGFVEDAVKLSKVGFTDTATAVDTLTTVINAYGYSADDAQMIMGRLVQTQNKGKTTVNELAHSMGNVIPTASAYNVSLDNLSSAYVILTKQGIDTANATTAINGMLTELADGGSTVAQILQEKTGKSFGQLMADGADLGEVIQILSDSVDGDSEAFANLWGNVRASKGALAIANAGADEFTQAMDDMADSTGLVDSALQDLQTPSALANRAINSVKNTGIKLGQELLKAAVPTLEKLVDKAHDLYQWFSNLDDGTKQNIVRFGALAVAAGPVLIAIGKVSQGIGGMLTTLGTNVSKVAAFSGAMKMAETEMMAAGATSVSFGQKVSAAAGKTGLLTKATSMLKGGLAAIGIAAAVAAIGLIVTKVMEWKKHNDDVKKSTDGLREAVNASKAAYEGYTPKIDAATGAIEASAKSAHDCIAEQAQLADTLSEKWADVGTNAAMVDYYAQIIADLGEKGSLTAEEQGKLTMAVQGFNDLTGESIGIVNAQTGELTMQKDAVMALAESYKEEARAQAAREAMVDIQRQMLDNEVALRAANDELAKAQEDFNNALQTGSAESIQVYSDRLKQAQGNVTELENANSALQDTFNDYAEIASSTVANFDSMDAALESCGGSIGDLGDISEDTLNAMRGQFDGSLNSIVKACANNGVKIPKSVADGIRRNSGLPEAEANVMFDAMVLQMTNGDIEAAAELLGHDLDAGLMDGIKGNSEMPTAAMGVLSDDVIRRAKSTLGVASPSTVFKAIGSDLDSGLKLGIEGGKGGVTSAMGTISTSVINAIKGLPDKVKPIGTNAGEQFSKAIGSKSQSAKDNAAKLSNSAQSGVSGAPNALKTTGANAAGGFAQSVGRGSAYQEAQNLATTAKSGAGSVSLYSTGQNAMQGFVNGMSATEAVSVARNMAAKVRKTVESMFGIASPSKVFAYYGEMLGAGLIEGMQSQEQGIDAEVGRYGDLLTMEPQGEVATSYQAAGASAVQSAGSPTFNISVTVNGEMTHDAAVQAGEDMAEAAYRQWQQYRRAVA